MKDIKDKFSDTRFVDYVVCYSILKLTLRQFRNFYNLKLADKLLCKLFF